MNLMTKLMEKTAERSMKNQIKRLKKQGITPTIENVTSILKPDFLDLCAANGIDIVDFHEKAAKLI
jgi:hypothetical protein